MKSGFAWSTVLLCTLTFGLQDVAAENDAPSIRKDCTTILRSNCTASQEQMLSDLLKSLDIYTANKRLKGFSGTVPAFKALPKDNFGMVNWVKAVTDGLIQPRGSLNAEDEPPFEGFLDNIILLPANVHVMADVAFPHGMHTYWLSCDSCHPEPFSKEPGSNPIVMNEIFQGKWCGKCHGKVAFPPGPYENCRRCHAIPKNFSKTD